MPQTTTYQNPPTWLQPYITDYLNRAQDVAGQPYTQSPTQVAPINPTLNTGLNAVTNRAINGSPVMDAASGQLTNMVNGGSNGTAAVNANANLYNPYTGMNNPYLEQSITNAQGDLTRAWNDVQKPAWDTAMQRSGSFGNTGVMQANANAQNTLQQNLARIGTDMRNSAYNQSAGLMENQINRQFSAGADLANRQDNMFNANRGFQFDAVSLAPTFANQDYVDANQLLNAGNIRQGFNDRQAAQNYQWWQEAQNYPRQGLDVIGNAINVAGGGSGTSTTTTPGVPRANSVIGGGLIASQIYDLGKSNGWW